MRSLTSTPSTYPLITDLDMLFYNSARFRSTQVYEPQYTGLEKFTESIKCSYIMQPCHCYGGMVVGHGGARHWQRPKVTVMATMAFQ